MFYRTGPDGQVVQQPLKSPKSIGTYLRQQLAGAPAEHWVTIQTTQYSGKRNGGHQVGVGFTASRARHILAFVVDMDGRRMAPRYRQLLHDDWYAFAAVLGDLLGALGVECYRLVRSGPTGVHLYLPVVRPDGKPLRASEKTMEIWEKIARALGRYFVQLGADPNAAKSTQPFAVPGLARAKHPGFVPYVAGGRDGARSDLYALLRSLSALRMVAARERVQSLSPDDCGAPGDVQRLLMEIRERAAGLVEHAGRNQAAHDLAVYLLVKGATSEDAWQALKEWNRRNDPPLTMAELRNCFRSAERCRGRHLQKWSEMQRAPWNRLRSLLALPEVASKGYRRDGRWRPLTPARSWEQRKMAGGREHYHEVEDRLMTHLVAQGGRWEIVQAELSELLGTAVSTLKEVFKRLQAAGRLQVQTRRGRGGRTILTSMATSNARVTENSHSGIAPEGVEQGVWVGDAGEECLRSPAAAVDPLALLVSLAGLSPSLVSLAPSLASAVLVVVDAGGRWRLVARSSLGGEFIRLLEEFGALAEWRRRLAGGV